MISSDQLDYVYHKGAQLTFFVVIAESIHFYRKVHETRKIQDLMAHYRNQEDMI